MRIETGNKRRGRWLDFTVSWNNRKYGWSKTWGNLVWAEVLAFYYELLKFHILLLTKSHLEGGAELTQNPLCLTPRRPGHCCCWGSPRLRTSKVKQLLGDMKDLLKAPEGWATHQSGLFYKGKLPGSHTYLLFMTFGKGLQKQLHPFLLWDPTMLPGLSVG